MLSNNQSISEKAGYYLRLIIVFLEQVYLLLRKNVSQKQRNGRQFWKDSVMIQFFMICFVAYILYSNAAINPSADTYDYFSLPPLSTDKPWGIFNQNSNGNTENTIISKRLYYSPNNHDGVTNLMNALKQEYPSITIVAAPDDAGINNLYEANLFDTWASIEFYLTPDQISTNQLITSQTSPSSVAYQIAVNPINYGYGLSNENFTSEVYNKQACEADIYWSSGYLTLQNFIATYLAKQYTTVDPNFSVDTFLQRYPKSPVYENELAVNIDTSRNGIWKWIGPTILSICLFTPILSLLTEIVRERQYLMKDLLEISGMMNISYWFSYLLMAFILGEISVWFTIGILNAFDIVTNSRVGPYASLLTCYILASSTFGMAFGFVIPRSEYYALPVFLTTCALTVCGAYLAIADNIGIGLKLFFCFLSPSVGMTMGVIVIETYLFSHGSPMDYHFENENKNYPNLDDINMILLVSALAYFLITLALPLDWLLKLTSSGSTSEAMILNKAEDMPYPCDKEEEDTTGAKFLLKVNTMTQVYPDGTNAVKDMTFNVREGEVLSFLGANGAGKSTTMKMLCGTLDPTYGDATVNGYSITGQKTLARRNLGIAMQQDIIWDDVNVEDHLMLFGRLRGLHGQELRDAVTQMCESVGFPDKRKSLAGTLSGGQKRRLCVALSMVGGNSVVYLDEPTAGLDPVSRRQLWELVQRNREGRAILLTTHFMDEADVLGDRIAIVKEGRLRALGTAKFLKQRFGLGYLMRMSLADDAKPHKIADEVKRYIAEASIASSAGTELSIRLPREAVPSFPTVFERIEKQSDFLGIKTYGIETTTLEEVFMRIVNEDTEQLLTNHQEANRLLTAPAEEREANRANLSQRDDKRVPLSENDINALLTKGMNAYVHQTCGCSMILLQVQVMLIKRFYQFVRSRGQWAMGFVIPLVIAILVGLLLSTMPTQLIEDDNTPVLATYTNYFPTLVAGPNQGVTEQAMDNAFGQSINVDFVGNTYTDLYSNISKVATPGYGPSSTDGIYYLNAFNFSVAYNASYPINFAGSVQALLNAAISNVTDNKLILQQTFNSLPTNLLDLQLNNGFFVAMLVSLAAGSFGAGLSIVVSGERVSLVKHQQLASGASSAAYWIGNFIFDFVLMFLYVIIFGICVAIFAPSTYTGDGYGYVVGPGFFFVIAAIFRFYCISYLIGDVRLAQSIYFYGSLAVVFVVIDIWFTVLFTTSKGNVNNGAVQALAAAFTVIEPTFGWYLLILYQNNFLAILTQNSGSEFWSTKIGGLILIMLIVSAGLYAILFIVFTENALGGIWKSVSKAASNVGGGNTRQSMIAQDGNPDNSDNVVHVAKSTQVIALREINTELSAFRSFNSLDPDVINEREKVRNIVERGIVNRSASAIFINNLRKVYFARGSVPAKVAVKNINLSIPQGEIFGLLGANGAGKTTLLKMVSGLELPSSGFALINGYDVVQDTSSAQRSMGLCPQFDTLIERLSVRENLLFFGRIKGLANDQVESVCEAFMQAMNIKRYENKLIQQLSGGNRRKVSLAVALLGAPPTVYLDEPSTGLDPVACRLMWRLLSKIASAKSTAIVLTTHNMLECEAVCTRVCIMKLGEMVCLGDSQHLRSTHGTGFLLEVNLVNPQFKDRTKQFIENHFAGAVIIEEHSTLLNYEVPRASISLLSQAFRLLEENKQALGIDDYVLSQSTLEQVFLKQIRPNEKDLLNQKDQEAVNNRVPLPRDYITGYLVWAAAFFLPGLHHFYLGNTWRGVKYLCTGNEVVAGWLLDFFELHVLIQKSVQEKGHVLGLFYCKCCASNPLCCCLWGCCAKPVVDVARNNGNVYDEDDADLDQPVVTHQPQSP